MSSESINQQRKHPHPTSDAPQTDGGMPDGLPFAHLNLRRNPFGAVSEENGVQLAVTDVDELTDHLREPGTAMQFVADRGRGKTTQLRVLHQQFSDKNTCLRCVRRNETFHVPEVPFPFVDEFQRIDSANRLRLYHTAERIALTTHHSVADELQTHGFDVRTVHPGVQDPEQLKRIIDRRIEWARRDEGPVPELTLRDVRTLYDQFGSDLRSLFEHLYNVFQKLEEPGHVQL